MKNLFIKSLCFILATVMACGAMTISYAEEATTVAGEDELDALEILQMLDIVPEDYYDYNTSMSEEISRADFVDAVAKIVGMDNYTGSAYYYDVPKTHYAFSSISMLTELGVIGGVGDGLFEPEAVMEDAAAYKILLSLMGYNVRAEVDGGYPAGYMKAANRLELIYEGSVSSTMTRGEMLVVLVRAITTEVFEPVVFGKPSEYKVSDTETLLSLYHNVYFKEGIVTGAEMISISGPALDTDVYASVDNELYYTNVLLTDYLGEEIEYLVHKETESDEGTIIWAKKTGGTEVLTLDYGEATGFDKDSYVLSYIDDSDKDKTVTIDRGVTLVYNGRIVDKNIDEIFNLPRYTAKIVKTDGKNNIAIVKAYDTIVVGAKDNTSQQIFDTAYPEKNLPLLENEYDYMVIRKSDGSDMTYADIAVNQVVSVFKSLDKKYLELIVSAKSEAGVLTKTSSTSEEELLTIGDNTYAMLKGTKTDAYSVGDSVTLFLDYTGTVAYIKATPSNSYAAYIFKAAVENIGFGDKVKFRALKQDGTIVELECAEKITVDGGRKENATEILENFTEYGEFTAKLALVDVNADGKVIRIDTPYVDPEHESKASSLSQNIKNKNIRYRPFGAFVQEAVIDNSTVIFKVPAESILDTAEDTDYTVIGMNSLVNDGKYTIDTFNTTERFGYEKYVVVKHDRKQEYRSLANPILVTSIGEKMNSTDEIVECIEGYQGASKVTCISDGTLSFKDLGIKEGMLITPETNNMGEAYNVTVIFDPENPVYKKGEYSDRGFDVGYVNDVIGNVMRIGCTDPSVVDRVIQKRSAQVLVYDKADDRNPIYVGSFSDARPYYNVKDECSTVVVITTYEESNLFVIYNNL